jgi:hypothetical protein
MYANSLLLEENRPFAVKLYSKGYRKHRQREYDNPNQRQYKIAKRL